MKTKLINGILLFVSVISLGLFSYFYLRYSTKDIINKSNISKTTFKMNWKWYFLAIIIPSVSMGLVFVGGIIWLLYLPVYPILIMWLFFVIFWFYWFTLLRWKFYNIEDNELEVLQKSNNKYDKKILNQLTFF